MEPIIRGIEIERTEQRLVSIIDLITSNLPKVTEPGLFNGKVGISILLFHWYRITKQQLYEEIAFGLLQETISEIGKNSADHSYSKGLNGICCAIGYLAQNGFIENNLDEIFSEIDKLYQNPVTFLLDYSLDSGMISYGMYYLLRMTNNGNQDSSNKKLLTQIIKYLDFFIPEHPNEDHDPENLTIMKGYLSIIPFLCKVYKVSIQQSKVKTLLIKYVNFVLQHEDRGSRKLHFPNQTQSGSFLLQWNSGDLTVANLLLLAATTIGNCEWKRKALRIALGTTVVEEIENENIYLINGTAGITHLYNRLYQYFKNPELKKATIFWLNKTSEFFENNQPVNYGLINGLSGVGLVLISSLNKMELSWDDLLLIS